MLIIATHYGEYNGQIQHNSVMALVTFLLAEKQEPMCVLYRPLEGVGEAWTDVYSDNDQPTRKRVFSIKHPSSLRFFTDVIFSIVSLWRYTGGKQSYYIGADPLNAIVGIIYKRLGRVRATVYYSLDYTPERFNRPLLNRIYHACDRFAMHNSDFIWSVSDRIVEVRRQMGLEDSRNIYVPNIPAPHPNSSESKRSESQFKLITVGSLDEQQSYITLIDAIKLIIVKYPQLTLSVVGTGQELSSLQQYVVDCGLSEVVTFTGYVSHEEVMLLLDKHGIGCAVYSGKWKFNYFSDSIKCREYLSFGLPILTTDTHSTTRDIRSFHAGVICDDNASAFADGIEELLAKYRTYSAGAIRLSEFHVNAKSRAYALLRAR